MTIQLNSLKRYTAYKAYVGTKVREAVKPGLTLAEARDEERFPVGTQSDDKGNFVWSYGFSTDIK